MITKAIDTRSNVRHEITHVDMQGFGNAIERIQRNRVFATFDFTDVVRVKFRQFRKFLLGEAHSPSVGADGLPDSLAMFRYNRHKPVKQSGKDGSFQSVNCVLS